MSDDSRPLVDGARPAVEWVRRLPRNWTSSRERLVLMLLALDTFDQVPPFTCSPKLDQLSEWSGEYKGRVSEAISSLEADGDDGRPSLLEVTRGTGRTRSIYRLRTEHGAQLWYPSPDHNGLSARGVSGPGVATTSNDLQSGGPDHDLQSGYPDHKGRSGPGSGPGSSPESRTTPFPSPLKDPGSPVVIELQEEAEHLCELLADRIVLNGSARPAITDVWLTATRQMLTEDGRQAAEVAEVIAWCQNDTFWRSIVLSMPKLRDKYDQMRLAAKRPTGAKSRNDIDWTGALGRAEAREARESTCNHWNGKLDRPNVADGDCIACDAKDLCSACVRLSRHGDAVPCDLHRDAS